MNDFLVTYLLHSTVVLGLTLALLRLPAFRNAAFRDVVLRVAVVAGLFAAAFSPVQRQTIAFAAPVRVEQTPGRQVPEMQSSDLEVGGQATLAASVKRPVDLAVLMVFGSLAFAALRLVAAWVVVRRARGSRVDDPDIQASLNRLVSRTARNVRVTAFWTHLSMPCAFGPRTILLPHNIRQRLSAAELDAVLAHEYAHLLRRDPLWNLALSLLTQLLWFQPLNWLALRMWRDACEERCDAWAAQSTPRLTLAQAILTLARRHPSHRVPTLIVSQAAPPTPLSARIQALLEPQEAHMKRSHVLALALLPALLGIATPPVAVAAASPLTVVLDAAHGGKDPGAVDFANEAEIVLVLARKVKAQLEKNGASVFMTRDGDTTVALEDRVGRIPANAAAYISIHLNASQNPAAQGPETYIASPDVNRTFAKSQRLGRNLQAELLAATGAKNKALTLGNGTFYVLRNSPVPAAMIEVGYATNAADGKALQDAAYQDRLAAAIARGILK